MVNEKRLIEPNVLLKHIEKFKYATIPLTKGIVFDYMRVAINSVPKVDAVEVVRCKDCKHCNDVSTIPTIADSLKLACIKGVNWRAVDPNHFCSYGERRSK